MMGWGHPAVTRQNLILSMVRAHFEQIKASRRVTIKQSMEYNSVQTLLTEIWQ